MKPIFKYSANRLLVDGYPLYAMPRRMVLTKGETWKDIQANGYEIMTKL